MAVSRNISPTLGVNLDAVYAATDALPLPLGTVVRGRNGRMYIFVQASAGIANDTAVVLTEPAMTVAGGAGAYTTRSGALTTGQRAWVESNAI
ncbi:hypothetical protein [Xanthobacter autotrophicus]|jgi:hypothetical protein|uniref:hypothetical protein n=1 Tax=Xanthobacter autotrophicus TaxID=280 RepID=UPI0037278616